MQRELQRSDIRTLQALQKEINRLKDEGEGDGIRVEMSGKTFVMMPLHQKVRFKGESWAVDCPVKFQAGSNSRTYVSGDQGDFEIDMMLLKFHLNVADNSGF